MRHADEQPGNSALVEEEMQCRFLKIPKVYGHFSQQTRARANYRPAVDAIGSDGKSYNAHYPCPAGIGRAKA